MIKLKTLLNEELIGDLWGYEVYKNPKSIKRMAFDLRGISFPNGDLFVIDDGRNTIHKHLRDWLDKNGHKMPPIETTKELMQNVKKGYIPWQRIATSNDFRLSESFKLNDIYPEKEYMPYVKKYLSKVKSKNPTYTYYYRNQKL